LTVVTHLLIVNRKLKKMAAESKLENYLKKRVKELGGQTRKIKWIGRKGAPDELVWIPKWVWPKMAEMKAPGEPLEEHQKREHRRLKKMGVKCVKLDNVKDIDRFLK